MPLTVQLLVSGLQLRLFLAELRLYLIVLALDLLQVLDAALDGLRQPLHELFRALVQAQLGQLGLLVCSSVMQRPGVSARRGTGYRQAHI